MATPGTTSCPFVASFASAIDFGNATGMQIAKSRLFYACTRSVNFFLAIYRPFSLFFLFLRERKKFDKKGCIEALNEANSPLTFVSVLRLFRAVESAVRGRIDIILRVAWIDRASLIFCISASMRKLVLFLGGILLYRILVIYVSRLQ